jgi:hypothetical protein
MRLASFGHLGCWPSRRMENPVPMMIVTFNDNGPV